MRIGLFTDTYHPSVNGITFVVETLKRNLEAIGHEVYVFCPAGTMMPDLKKDERVNDERIIRIPSFTSGLFDDFDLTVFFPPAMVKKVQALDLDVIHIFTPSQIGFLGINSAYKDNKPFVVHHCTDLYEFVEHYPNVLPGALAIIGVLFPMSVKLKGKDIKEIIKLYRPRRGAVAWNRDIISRAITMIYSRASAVIVLCQKSYNQLKSWQDEDYNYEMILMPDGINALPKTSPATKEAFRKKWGLKSDDEVFGFVGRLGEEKNLPVLIKAMDHVGRKRPEAKLLFVGDFGFRKNLEEMAEKSKFADRIIFTGYVDRSELEAVYSALDIFVFPSLKDTQGWVLHEAAHAHKPIVLIDQELSEVAKDGVSGYFAKNNATDMARKIVSLLENPKKRQQFGDSAKKLASNFTERRQIRKLEKLYERVIREHSQELAD